MEIISNDIVSHNFYAVLTAEGKFFAGFNPEEGKADFVENPLDAKLFSNKYEIKLRPQERLVEFSIDLSKHNVQLSEPFRPKKRVEPFKKEA